MLKFFLSIILAVAFACPCFAQGPGYAPYGNFGDHTNARPCPTSGTLTGTYLTRDNWVQAGAITCNACRLIFGGNSTFNNNVTAVAGVEGNAAPVYGYTADATDSTFTTIMGNGPGRGLGFVNQRSPGTASSQSGAGHGGAGGGGSGGSTPQPGGQTYPLSLYLAGSSGGSSVTPAVSSAGGGGFYVEACGNVTFTSACVIHADATTGSGSNYAGSSGGGVDIRALGNIAINSGAIITANGSNGLVGGAGGGGIISLMVPPSSTCVNNGTVTAAAGTASGGGSNGSAGSVRVGAGFEGKRTTY